MTVKHIDTFSKNWSVAIAGVLSFGYFIFLLPFHIILAGFMFLDRDNTFHGHRQQDIPFTIFIWMSLALTICIIIYNIYKQRKNLKAFTSHFKEFEMNNPHPQNIVKNRTGWGLLSLDTQKGTLLYINHPDTTIFNFFFPRDVRVMGFGMYDYKSIELEGNTLRIYTGNPELPYVAIASGKAPQLYEKINAMRGKPWKYENNIPGYVEHNAIRIAEKQGLNLILPPA